MFCFCWVCLLYISARRDAPNILRASSNDITQELGLSFADEVPPSHRVEPCRTASICSILDKKELGFAPSECCDNEASTVTSTSGSCSQFHTLPNTELLEAQMKASLFSSPPLRPQQPQLQQPQLQPQPQQQQQQQQQPAQLFAESEPSSITVQISSPTVSSVSAPTDSASQLVPDKIIPPSLDALAECQPSSSTSNTTASSSTSSSSQFPRVASGLAENSADLPKQLTERVLPHSFVFTFARDT